MKKKKKPSNRRQNTMAAAEVAYQQGLRRRASDREEVWAYYIMFVITLGMLVFIGVGSWLVS